MGRGNSKLFKGTRGASINIQLFAINKQKQERHNYNNNNGRSVLFGGSPAAEDIIKKYGGKGTKIGNKERVVCDHIVGLYRTKQGKSELSNVAIIVRSKTGEHVYPGQPQRRKK